jgi:hypothetical protein
MTWYYGIGYEYYSADGTGYYNVENAYDQYAKSTASKWGCAVYVKNTATGFSADGIVFENSFNRYLTDEEIEDRTSTEKIWYRCSFQGSNRACNSDGSGSR